MLEVREDGKHHPRDARLAPTCPFCPDAVVDTAVALEPSIKKELTGLSRLPGDGQQTEVTEHQHGVGGRDPLWRVEPAVRRQPAGPRTLRVLASKRAPQPSRATFRRSRSTVRSA